MKKFILGIVIGAIIFIPTSALAVGVMDIIPGSNMIYTVPTDPYKVTVSVFDDGTVKCYIATPPTSRDTKPSISCLEKRY